MDPILSRNPYSELPLNGRSTCIRVLDLTPGTWNEDLQGTPRIVDLYSRPKYEALSYTWGNGNEREAIFLGHGCQLQITYNLFTALKRLRNLCSIRTVWADAVCINQSDAGEKSQQVPLMGEIYKTAENVLIWLGEYEHTSSRDRWRVIIPNLLWIFSRHWPRARNFKVAEMMESALRSSRPRWTDRAWVVQEFMLAQRVSLCFGPIVASIDRFDRDGCSIELFGRFPTQLNESTQSNKPNLRSLFDTISWYQMQKSSIKWLNITTTSLMTNGTECEDPRDKIYSVLSLIRSRQADYIQPDYSIPCSETYAKATFADITVEKCLDILALVAVKQPREPFDAQSTGRIPTWVPDFRANYRGTRVEEFYGFFFSHDFPSMHLPKVEASGCLSECAKHLTCSGFALGQVTNVLNVPLSEDLALSNEEFRQLWLSVYAVLESKIPSSRSPKRRLPIPPFFNTDAPSFRGVFAYWDEATNSKSLERPSIWPHWGWDGRERRKEIHDPGHVTLKYFFAYAKFVHDGPSFIVSSSGHTGFASQAVGVDDEIVLFPGSRLPMILRRSNDNYQFRGLALIHGLWQRYTAPKSEKLEVRRYVLC